MHAYNLTTAQGAGGFHKAGLYNCVDVIATRRAFDVLMERADPQTIRTYGMERSVQNAAFAMSSRGLLVDEVARSKGQRDLSVEKHKVERRIAKMPQITDVFDMLGNSTDASLFGPKAVMCPKSKRKDGHHSWPKGVEDSAEKLCEQCGRPRLMVKPFNPGSPDQVMHLFYDLYKCQVQTNKKRQPSVDEDCMDKLARKYPKYKAVSTAIIDYRDLTKQLGFLKSRLRGGRFYMNFNVGATLTARWSSNKDNFGDGANGQNITERWRHIFIADPGKTLFYADLKQAESNAVAHMAGDDAYIEAHRSGDVHTFVTRFIWPDLPWTGDLAKDKAIAKQLPEWDPVPGHDYRFQAKKFQHGSNYGLTPRGIAIIEHIPLAVAEEGQARYFQAFPKVRAWQNTIRDDITNMRALVNPLGIRTKLYGRPWDEHTYKQGLSIKPQGLVAHIIDLAAEQIYNELDPWQVWLLAQIHDALLGEVDDGNFAAMERILELMSIPIPVTDIYGVTRTMQIETEMAIGKNWGHQVTKPIDAQGNPQRLNMQGLKEWTPS